MESRLYKGQVALAMRLVKAEDVLIVGAAIYLSAVLALDNIIPTWDLNLVLAMLYGMCGVAGVNSLNQVHDAKIDAINKPLRPIPSKRLKEKTVIYISGGLLTTGALIAIYLFFVSSYIYVVVGLLGLFTALIYTLPTTRFKKYTMLSTGIMGFGYGPFIFLAGWAVYRDPIEAPLWILVFLYFHEVFVLITKDYRDVKGDRAYGMRTLPVILGRERAASLNYILYLLPFFFVTAIAFSGQISYDPTLLLFTGAAFGLPMFWLCGQPKVSLNIAGYYVYILAFIVIRVILAFTV